MGRHSASSPATARSAVVAMGTPISAAPIVAVSVPSAAPRRDAGTPSLAMTGAVSQMPPPPRPASAVPITTAAAPDAVPITARPTVEVTMPARSKTNGSMRPAVKVTMTTPTK